MQDEKFKKKSTAMQQSSAPAVSFFPDPEISAEQKREWEQVQKDLLKIISEYEPKPPLPRSYRT